MEPNDLNSIPPEINPESISPKIIKPFPLNLIVGLLIGVLVTSTSYAAFYFYQKSKDVPAKQISNIEPQATITPDPTTTDNFKITWLTKPQKIIPLNDVFIPNLPATSTEGFYFSQASFYLVANMGDGTQLIDYFLPMEGPGNYSNIYRFIKSPSNQISILKTDTLDQVQKYLTNKVNISTISFKELDPPVSIIDGGINLSKGYSNNQTFDTLTNPQFVKSTEYGDLYVVYYSRKDFVGVQDKTYYLKLKDWVVYTYKPKYNFLSDSQSTYIKWNDNTKIDDQFSEAVAGGGCGGTGGTSIIKDGSNLLNNKIAIASYDQKTIYQITDTNNSFLKKLYELYKSTSQYITPAALPNIETYASVKNHFLYQDFSGDWVIFTNQKYTLQAECGKPVIYLYPQKETQIKVQVGAQITKSEPSYPQSGWVVSAKPNGELSYQNKIYPNLFWEGLGNGIYPDYKNRGVVVTQKDLIPTVNKQLKQLGLNTKESADFMEFWQSKLPQTPYIRLTWLNTSDMDKLAPLTVNPQPDTKIRVFLEFEGLQKPVNLNPQTLSAPVRKGFTLVEWGGLLLGSK